MKYLIILLITAGCCGGGETNATTEEKFNPLDLQCVKLKHNASFWGQINKCENEDVVCYLFDGDRSGGMSCKFKGE